MKKPKIIAIIGPNASGKSALGIYLAQKIQGEIISADSRQVYTAFNITAGKISKKEQSVVPHHLLQGASLRRIFSVSDYVKRARRAIAIIEKKNAVPIVVGGTGLYIDALLGRIVLPNVSPNDVLRARLEKKSAAELYTLLKNKDARRAKTIEPHHKRRLIRALEIAEALGKNPKPTSEKKYKILWLGLNPDERVLRKKIHKRILIRFKQSLVAEAKQLHMRGLSYRRMEELGFEYRLLAHLLRGNITRRECMEALERASMHYAKRQTRWFSRNAEIVWIKNKLEALRYAKKFLQDS